MKSALAWLQTAPSCPDRPRDIRPCISYLVGGLGDGFSKLEQSGWMGVDLFFVLSGYLIGTQVLKSLATTGRLDFAAFYGRRAVRILPAFFTVLALYVLWPAWRETPGMQPLWQFPTFTFNLLFDNGDNYAFSHVWSLCVEEHFYLVFPILAFTLTRKPAAWKLVVAGAVVVVGGMFVRGWSWTHWLAPAQAAGENVGTVYLRYLYYPTWARLDGLLAGVALAVCGVYRPRAMAWLRARVNGVLILGALLLATALMLFDGARTGFWPCVVGYPLIALAMAAFVAAASGDTWLARLDIPGAGWLARASYSLYLSHKGVFHLVQGALDGQLADHRFLRFAIYAAATLAGGAVLHYAVERPFLRWRDKRAARSATLSAPKVIHGVSAGD
ncbi:peptidoglycan/LPS O-acetylase OafA/YrhL [Luteibacter jiangsuensis]|uniref:Peptidoglycan/LPS O-acetylase OafA/YrhL n=1 Tax=Luteibacter jiangsuensis TaxID=637577 RepID=A0ABT9SXR3_9GAMM|nr:peptidoglycan/LPS O-acetylase OafA/YrhL [Luteibacter jiangsuensis]